MSKLFNKKHSMSPKEFNLDKDTIFRLLNYLKPYTLKMLFVVLCLICTAVISVYMSVYIKVVIDDYIKPMLLQDNANWKPFVNSIAKYACILSISVITSLVYNLCMVNIAQSIIRDIRNEMFNRMQHYPISYFDKNKYGDIMSHYVNDVDTLREFFDRCITQTINSIITIISVFVSMLMLSCNLTIFVLAGVFFIVKYSSYIAKNSGKHFFKSQEDVGELDAFVEEMINGDKEVKTFCYEEENKKHFDEKNIAWRNSITSANTYASTLFPSMAGFGNFLYVLIAIIGAYFAINKMPNVCLMGINTITIGTIVSFLTLTKSFVRPITETSSQMNTIMQALSGAKRIFNFLDEEYEVDNGKIELKKEDVKGEIVLTNVDFAYVDNKYVLTDISIYAKMGQKIALVGHTGAGKTTITNLINRFYDVTSGQITYDGIDIKEYTKKSLRNSLAVVLQEVNLFTGSVMDNVRYGNLDATDEECINAAKMANAHSFIEMLPQGYNTIITSGGESLSQGQRQLISIARAIVADPKVLILDEATSSIDTRTEKLISKGMDKLMEGRTVFVIAHRLSTIRNAKAIMVMENGRIIERGDHNFLMEQKGKYYQLYTGALTLD